MGPGASIPHVWEREDCGCGQGQCLSDFPPKDSSWEMKSRAQQSGQASPSQLLLCCLMFCLLEIFLPTS